MSPIACFALSLVVTLVLLGAVVATGLRAARRPHLVFVACAVVSLVATIVFAERLGRVLDLEASGVITPIHLAIAKLTTLSYLGPVITGVMTLRDPRHRKLHFRVAMVVLLLTVLTAATGTLMVAWAEPLQAAG